MRSLLTPGDISGSAGVIITNVLLALGVMVIILLSATIFNQTVQENSDDLHNFFGRLLGPFRGIAERSHGAWAHLGEDGGPWAAVLGPLVMLGLAGVIYGFAEPGFGLNNKSLVLFLSIVLGFGIVTYTFNGGQVLMTRTVHRAPAGLRLIPIGIAVAIVSVILSRLENFQPGIIYGFIATFAVLGVELDRRQSGQVVFVPALGLLAVCVAAWLLLSPARDLSNDHSGWLAALPEGVAVAVFVAGLEGLFFNMIPLHFMDGHKLWNWNKAAWLAMAGVTSFLFWHVLLNREKSSFSALQETTAATALILVGVCLVLSLSFWLFFRLRAAGGTGETQPA